jgi:TonB family protein
MNAVSIRGDWVGRVIDGRFSLVEWLGGSGTCGTFLTELDGPGSQKATLKLFSAPEQAEERLSAWKTMADLSHVHLVRILHFGRTELDGTPLVCVVTEFAEEVLSQIIPERPLTADEAREMLGTVLDALSYVHAKGFVHGHLKPSNILVVENEVKLSADGLNAAGTMALEVSRSDVHNAPETASTPIEPVADIWSLGVTVVEALTQNLPVWDAASGAEPSVPASLPKPFAEITRACLIVDPARRCNLSDVRALLEGRPKSPLPLTQPATDLAAAGALAEPKAQSRVPIVPLIVGLVVLVVIAIGFAIRSHRTNTAPLQSETTQQAPPAEPESKVPSLAGHSSTVPKSENTSATTGGTARGDVAHRDVPDVPRRASDTVHGKVTVAVRVSVNAEGAVTDAEFTTHGPSAYFARLAMESAHKWTFKPPQANGHATVSTWILRYEFRRTGADVIPQQTNP